MLTKDLIQEIPILLLDAGGSPVTGVVAVNVVVSIQEQGITSTQSGPVVLVPLGFNSHTASDPAQPDPGPWYGTWVEINSVEFPGYYTFRYRPTRPGPIIWSARQTAGPAFVTSISRDMVDRDANFVRKILEGRWKIDETLKTHTFFDGIAGTTPLKDLDGNNMTYKLLKQDGVTPSLFTVFERKKP